MGLMAIRDVELYVRTMGQGYPLVLMHGGPGADHSTLLCLKGCADRFTMVWYDHRCNGRSMGDVTSMTFENLTADAEALRQALGFDKWAVLGHSFGGMVALEYALRYPASLSHLLLLDTCGASWWAQENAPALLAKRGYSASAVQTARRFFHGELAPREVLPAMFKFGKAYYYHPPIWVFVGGVHVKMRADAQVYGFRHLLPGWTVMDRLSEIQVPTLVLAGRDDFQFPPEHQAILAEHLPNAQLELIEHAGHNAPMEQPTLVSSIIKQFVSV